MVKKIKENTITEYLFPPVVAVLGHVDHGKTTLLDTFRKTNVAQGEHGGITQKIGASQIEVLHEGKKRKITFIDTPGHEAFSQMRTRGAAAADIGLLIVSAVDGVMPQTKESIALLKESGIPYIAVITKSDSPEKNTEKAKQQLLKEGILLEGYGGDVALIEVSAKTNSNIKELLDLILLSFDMHIHSLSILPSSQNPLQGIIIESKLDKKAGPKATMVIKNGILNVKDELISQDTSSRTRAIINDAGQNLKSATVGEAVEILGFEKVPKVGSFVTLKSAVAAVLEVLPPQSLEIAPSQALEIAPPEALAEEGLPPIIICADTEGSLEAVVAAMPEGLIIVSKKTGAIEASDVLFAKSIAGIVLGFNIKLKPEVLKLAATEKVLIRNYDIIYEMIGEITDLLEGKRLSMIEQVYGKAKILASFPFEKTIVLGLAVLEGRVAKGDKIRIMHDETIVGESHVTSVRQGKNQISKVEKGQECGIIISPVLDFTIGDMLICHN